MDLRLNAVHNRPFFSIMASWLAATALPNVQTWRVRRERLVYIWSQARLAELPLSIRYRVRQSGSCRIFDIERIDELT